VPGAAGRPGDLRNRRAHRQRSAQAQVAGRQRSAQAQVAGRQRSAQAQVAGLRRLCAPEATGTVGGETCDRAGRVAYNRRSWPCDDGRARHGPAGSGRARALCDTSGVTRGDGQLTHDILPSDKAPQDACGVFGVWAPGEDVATLTYFGLYALQHRGQESAGIATSNGEQILVYKDLGLVSQVFDDMALSTLTGHIALGHTRYATAGARTWENAQPTLGPTASGTLALGHNGNLTNTRELTRLVQQRYGTRLSLEGEDCASDTTILTALFAGDSGHSLTETALEMLPQVRGAFSLAFMTEDTLYAARDPQGIRPLVLGRLERGWVVTSETAALDIIGAAYVREVEPGELLVIDADGLHSHRFAEARPKGCVFEYVYL